MRKIINFFKRKWVIQLIGIIALCALIWFFGPLLAIADVIPLESEISRFLVILAIVLLWGINNLRIQAAANRTNQEMLADLTVKPEAKSDLADRSDEEIGILSDDFNEALELLKKSQSKGKRDKQYLYELPWYIIIGPPGSGKTTALINSGLKFPLSDRFGAKKIRGVGGTRNCDWWFTDDAVLLDTAGRYTTQDSQQAVDQAAWQGFLGLLKKHRPRRPINGALITMSIDDLIQQTEEERHLHASSIRQRIQELNDVLGIQFPIYMLFTKCDLVAGFTDFFNDLTEGGRAQVWGETFPVADHNNPQDFVGSFIEHFDGLIERLNSRLINRTQDERDMQRRSLIFGFPQQMAFLNDSLGRFLQDAFGATRYQTAPLLRGVYFTSGTQEGTPIDRLMGILAASFKLDRQKVPVYSGRGRSYFIKRLLKDVVFQEAELTGVDQRLELRRLWMQRGAYASAIGLTIVVIALWVTSFTRNQLAVSSQEEFVDEYQVAAKVLPDWKSDMKLLLPRLNATYKARNVFPDDNPWLMGLGLYQGDKLRPAADLAYRRVLKNYFLPTIAKRLEYRINGSSAADIDVLYQLLRVYLMLGDPSRFEAGLGRPWISIDWEKLYANEPKVQADLLTHLDSLLSLKLEAMALDEGLIARTRRILNQVPVAQQVYARIKSDSFADHGLDFSAYKAMGRFAGRVFDSADGRLDQLIIPGLFTYQGFQKVFLKESLTLAKEQVEQDWVLDSENSPTPADIKRLQKDLQRFYFRDYTRYWDELLDKIVVKRFQNVNQSLDLLEYASGSDSPISRILNAVEKNTSLTRPLPGAAEALNKLKQKGGSITGRMQNLLNLAREDEETPVITIEKPGFEVDRHFDKLNDQVRGETPLINRTLASLGELHGFMSEIGSTSGGDASLRTAVARMTGDGGDIIGRLRLESRQVPDPLKRWINAFSAHSWGVILGGAKTKLNKIWRADVLPAYEAGLKGRYPLFRKSSEEATLADFSHFFGANGVIDQFFNTHLRPFVDTTRQTWRAKQLDQQSIGLSSSALRQLQYAAKIRDVFFRGSGEEPVVEFDLKPVYLDASVSKFTLNLDGQTNMYRHGPMVSRKYQWPGPDATGRVRLVFESLNGKLTSDLKEGTWAWFRTLDDATTEQTKLADWLRVTFRVGTLKARYQLHATSVVNPFRLTALENFRCPKSL